MREQQGTGEAPPEERLVEMSITFSQEARMNGGYHRTDRTAAGGRGLPATIATVQAAGGRWGGDAEGTHPNLCEEEKHGLAMAPT